MTVMRLRVWVEWEGCIVEDAVVHTRSLRIGAGGRAQVAVPGPADVYIHAAFRGQRASVFLPVALVAEVQSADGKWDSLSSDRHTTLDSSLSLRLHAGPTVVHLEALPAASRRFDVPVTAWSAGALLIGTYFTAGLAFTGGVKAEPLVAADVRAQAAASERSIRWVTDLEAPLLDEGHGGEETTERAGSRNATRYAQLLTRGFARYVKSDLYGAERIWTLAAELVPQRPEAFIDLAQVEKRRGNLAAAESLLERSLAMAPGRCDALVDLGLVEASRGYLERGKASLARAAAACGARTGFVKLHLAAVLGSTGELMAAESALDEAVQALIVDDNDKRSEALSDLEHEPLFASLRGRPMHRHAIERLRTSCERSSTKEQP